ncbi:hypothetical protein BVRB_5g118150 [Beta vulgaris subsp. vulgaris]|nr:hypothetical protein BVRB_5g118150 [Beta vulgaris subsp. vulgaris]
MAYYVTPHPHKQRYPYGRDSTHSGDYHAHNTGLEDVPRYPSVYRDVIESSHEDGDGIIHIEHQHQHHHHQHLPKATQPRRQRVHFAEESSDACVHKLIKDKGGVIRSVDDAADGFIKANHRCFELRNWNTFKM